MGSLPHQVSTVSHPPQSSTLSQSPVLALLLTVLSLSLAQGPAEDIDLPDLGPPEDAEDLGPPDNVVMPKVVDREMQAFEECESDGEEGLTWNEVEACEDKFGTLLAEKGIGLPSQTDFEAA